MKEYKKAISAITTNWAEMLGRLQMFHQNITSQSLPWRDSKPALHFYLRAKSPKKLWRVGNIVCVSSWSDWYSGVRIRKLTPMCWLSLILRACVLCSVKYGGGKEKLINWLNQDNIRVIVLTDHTVYQQMLENKIWLIFLPEQPDYLFTEESRGRQM